jgi:hypothetical protein
MRLGWVGWFGFEEVRKILLFLKKKKQKDFFTADADSRPAGVFGTRRAALTKVFFASFFFRKKKSFCLSSLVPTSFRLPRNLLCVSNCPMQGPVRGLAHDPFP